MVEDDNKTEQENNPDLEIKQDDKGVTLVGEVIEILPNMQFKVQLQNGIIVLAYSSGKMRKNKIRIILYDKVSVKISNSDLPNLGNPSHLVKARLDYRLKK